MLKLFRKHFKLMTWAILSYVFGVLCSSLYFLTQKSEPISAGASIDSTIERPRLPKSGDSMSNSGDRFLASSESIRNSTEPTKVLGEAQRRLLQPECSGPTNADKFLNQLFIVPDIFSSEEGAIGDEFAMVTGITNDEREDLEKIFMECMEEIRMSENENLEQIGDDGLRYRLNSFAENGAAINDKFITEARKKLDPETFGRFMKLGYDQIYSEMGSFGKYAYDIEMMYDGEELVMILNPVGDFTGDASSPHSARYSVSEIPERYKHLFKIGNR